MSSMSIPLQNTLSKAKFLLEKFDTIHLTKEDVTLLIDEIDCMNRIYDEHTEELKKLRSKYRRDIRELLSCLIFEKKARQSIKSEMVYFSVEQLSKIIEGKEYHV